MVWPNEQGSILPFGKYGKNGKNLPIEDLPYSYLTWLLEQPWFEESYPKLMEEANEDWLYRRKHDERMED